MKNKQRIAGGFVALCMAASVLPVSAQAARLDRYDDIPANAWYYDAVDHMVAEDYFEGVSDSEFAPDAKMTRAMFVTVLARYDNATYKTSQSAYVDVPTGTWYTGAVNWAAYNGLVEGKGGGRFDPDGLVTREEMCTILNRYFLLKDLDLEKQNVSVSFKDANKISTWATGAVKKCVQYGIVTGYPDGTFLPQATATRAEVASILYKLSLLIKKGALPGGSGSSGGSGGSGGSGSGGSGGSGGGSETVISAGDLVGQGLDKAAALANKSLNDDKDAAGAETSLDYVQKAGRGVIDVRSEAELTRDFSTVLVEEAVEMISVAKAATTGEELTESQIKKAIGFVSDELGMPVSDAWKNALAKDLAARTEGLGKAMHAELRNHNGGYPFTAIAVEDGAGVVLYTVDMAAGKASLTDEQIVAALAKELGGQMKESLRSHNSAAYKLNLDAELELDFTIAQDKALAECTDTVDVEISAYLKGDGSVLYYYNTETEMDCLKTEITPDQQNRYDEKINEVLQTALDKVLENSDTRIPAGMDVKPLLTGDNVRSLLNGDYDELYDEIDEVVGNMATEEQIDAELAKQEEYDFTFGQLVDALENPKLSNGMKKTFKNYMVKAAVAKIHEKVDGTDYEDAVKAVDQYIAHTAINGVIHRNYPDAAYLDSFTEEVKEEAINSGKLDALIDALKEEDAVADAIDTAEPFEKLMTFDSMREMPMGEFADVLRDKNVADAMDKQDESVLEDITASLAAIPNGASVTIGGRKISAAKISAVKTANTPKAARLAVADVMDALDTLTLADFDDGEDITVHYTGGDYTMNMTIYA